jgi:hypothetical protein
MAETDDKPEEAIESMEITPEDEKSIVKQMEVSYIHTTPHASATRMNAPCPMLGFLSTSVSYTIHTYTYVRTVLIMY